jgi:hypothetical protein
MSHYLNNNDSASESEDLHLVNPSKDIKLIWLRDSLMLKIDAYIDGQLSAIEWKEIEPQILSDKFLFEYLQERTHRFKHISNLIPLVRLDVKQKEKMTQECSQICQQSIHASHQAKNSIGGNLLNKVSKIFNLN